MDNHKDTAPKGYVSEAKYAELMALYQVALSSAAEKEERLMAEQVLRNELVERECAEYKASIEAKFDEKCRKMLEAMERTWEGLVAQFESKVRERVGLELHKTRSGFYALIKSGIDAFKSLYAKEKDPSLIARYLESLDRTAADAKESMEESVKKSIETVARKALSKNRQVDNLVRMVFLQKSERHLFEEGVKYADAIADRLGLTDGVREQARTSRAFLKEYYEKVQAEKILLDKGNVHPSHGKNKIPENLIRLEPEYLYPEAYLENPDLYDKIGEDRKEWVVVRNLSVAVRVLVRPLFLAGDGSPFPVIDNEKHRAVKHYVVVFRDLSTDIPVFLTTPGGSRGKKVIQGYLADSVCRAFLCDAYAGYDWLARVGVLLCRCNAHSRRKFEQALKENPTRGSEAVLLYQLIYNVEDVIKRDGLSGKEKAGFRKRLAGPLWDEFKLWAAQTLLEVSEGSLMAEACGYLLLHYDELTAYLDIPEMPIDNNRTEYEIRSMF